MLYACVLFVGVLTCILVSRVCCDTGGNLLDDNFAHPIGIGPGNVTKLLVKNLDYVREAVKLRFGLASTTQGGYRFDFGICIGKDYPHTCLFFDPVAFHVDSLEDTL